MSANSNGNGRGNGGPPNGGDPPAHAGPPDRVTRGRSERTDSGEIQVGDDRREQLAQSIDWDNLTPFQEYVILALTDAGLIEGGDR